MDFKQKAPARSLLSLQSVERSFGLKGRGKNIIFEYKSEKLRSSHPNEITVNKHSFFKRKYYYMHRLVLVKLMLKTQLQDVH